MFSKYSRTTLQAVFVLLLAAPALADGGGVDFALTPSDADPAMCRAALESGKMLKSDETGTYIFSGYHLFRFTVEAGKLTCTAMFVTNP